MRTPHPELVVVGGATTARMAELRRPALKAESFTWISKASRDLGLSPRTLWKAIERGELPAYVFGRRAHLKVADVRAWIEAHRRRP